MKGKKVAQKKANDQSSSGKQDSALSIIPNGITVLNGLSAMGVILLLNYVFALNRQGNKDDAIYYLSCAGWTMTFGMLCDALDGTIARLLGASSKIGAELDSLCDAISFGFVPPLYMFVFFDVLSYPEFQEGQWTIFSTSHLFMFLGCAFYLCCALLRLARFNTIEDQKENHSYFRGLPSPGGAAAILCTYAFLGFLFERGVLRSLAPHYQFYLYHSIPLITAFYGYLMISGVKYLHFMRMRGSFVVSFIAAVLCFVYLDYWKFICAIYALLYILHGPLLYVVTLGKL